MPMILGGSGTINSPTLNVQSNVLNFAVMPFLGRVDSSAEGGEIAFARAADNYPHYSIDVYGTSTTPSLRVIDAAAGASRLQINSSGHVTMPYQPAFMVYDNAVYTTNQTPVIWDQVILNNGGHYNTTNGRFTAPVTGMYYFNCTCQGRNTGAKQAYYRVNGSDFWRFGYVSPASNDDGPAFTGSMIRSLNAGDYVDVRIIVGGGDFWLNDISNFSGFLLG